jgi:membrane protease YdiL (CAAX protease family)
VGGLFVIIIALASLIHLVPELTKSQQLLALPAQFVLYVILYGAVWVIFRVKYERPVWRSLGWTSSRFPLWQAIVGGCALSFLIGLLGAALRTPQVHSPFEQFLRSPAWIAIFGVFAVLVGPVAEETIFRGFLQPPLTRDLGAPAGIAITAAVFGLLHGPEYSGAWQYVILVGLAGACFGWVRYRSGSVIPAVLMHGGFNAVFFVSSIFVQSQIHK